MFWRKKTEETARYHVKVIFANDQNRIAAVFCERSYKKAYKRAFKFADQLHRFFRETDKPYDAIVVEDRDPEGLENWEWDHEIHF